MSALLTPIRECGYREQGGCYAECPTSSNGRPIWDFLFCPPRLVDAQALGLTPLGVHLIQDEQGVWNVFDIIGQDNYPSPLDWVQETMRYGLSRKLNPKLDFSKLTPESRMVMLHPRAYILNGSDYYAQMNKWKPFDWTCPKGVHEHELKAHPAGDDDCCIRLWWFDYLLGPSVYVPADDSEYSDMAGTWCGLQSAARRMKTFTFQVGLRPANVEPMYSLAIIGAFPIHRIAVIKDKISGKHKEVAKAAKEGSIPVEVVDE